MLLDIPPKIETRCEEALVSAGVAVNLWPDFQRWLRYFLDFCLKHTQYPCLETSLEAFSDTLESEGQEPWKRRQALDAVRLYWRMLGAQSNPSSAETPATGETKIGIQGTRAIAGTAAETTSMPGPSTGVVEPVAPPAELDGRRDAARSVAPVGAPASSRSEQAPVPPTSPVRKLPCSPTPASSLHPAHDSGRCADQYDPHGTEHSEGVAES